AGVFFIVDFNADAQAFGHSRGIQSQLGGVGGQGGVPVSNKRNSSDGQHHADIFAGKVADDLGIHPDRHAVHRLRIIGLVQQLQRIHKRKHHQVDGRNSVAPVDDPVVLGVKVGHVANRAPATTVVTAMPGAIDLDGGGTG